MESSTRQNSNALKLYYFTNFLFCNNNYREFLRAKIIDHETKENDCPINHRNWAENRIARCLEGSPLNVNESRSCITKHQSPGWQSTHARVANIVQINLSSGKAFAKRNYSGAFVGRKWANGTGNGDSISVFQKQKQLISNTRSWIA